MTYITDCNRGNISGNMFRQNIYIYIGMKYLIIVNQQD